MKGINLTIGKVFWDFSLCLTLGYFLLLGNLPIAEAQVNTPPRLKEPYRYMVDPTGNSLKFEFRGIDNGPLYELVWRLRAVMLANYGTPGVFRNVMLGDVNLDGVVTLTDAQIISQRALVSSNVTWETFLYDLTGDGLITQTDAQAAYSYFVYPGIRQKIGYFEFINARSYITNYIAGTGYPNLDLTFQLLDKNGGLGSLSYLFHLYLGF